jgi:hypothetical protein
VALASAMASASVSKRNTGATGPKVSSARTASRGDVGQHGGGVEALADARCRRPPPRALGQRVGHMASTLAMACSSISGPWFTPASKPLPTLMAAALAASFSTKRVVHAGLHVEAVGADAGLAGVAVLADHRAFDGAVEVGVVEDDEGRVAAQLQADLLDRRRALRARMRPTSVRAGERQVAHHVAGCTAPCRSRSSLAASAGDRCSARPAGMPARCASSATARADSGVCFGRLDDHRAARGQCREPPCA